MFTRLKSKIKMISYKKNNCMISDGVEICNSVLSEYCNLAHHSSLMNCKIGKRTSIGRYSKLRDCEIGSYCSISWDVTIGAVTHPLDRITTHAFTYRKQFGIVDEDKVLKQQKTIIGNDVWIGCGSIILSGVSIGDGAIIGAGAVVTKNVSPYSIVAGVPAKEIKTRNKEFDLSDLQWWEYDDECIKKNIQLFTCSLDQNVINSIKKLKGGR